MAWSNPKTDWNAADGVTNNDFNRIEANADYLKNTESVKHAKPVTAGGTASALTANVTGVALSDGLTLRIKLIHNLVNEATLNYGGSGAKHIVNAVGNRNIAGAVAGNYITVAYNGTEFVLQSTGASLSPQIIVTSNENCTVKVSKGSYTYTKNFTGSPITFEVPEYGLWSVSCTKADGKVVAADHMIDAVKQFMLTLNFFEAKIRVTTEPGASLKATASGKIFTGTANSSGVGDIVITDPGQYLVTATKGSDSATGQVNVQSAIIYPLALPFVFNILAQNTWEVIRKVSADGKGANFWKVGDSKPVTLVGNVGNAVTNGKTFDAFILGFNHNKAVEGSGIDFMLAKQSGKLVGMCSPGYDSYKTAWEDFVMNTSRTNSGGWRSCAMRTKLLYNADKNTTLSNLMHALPSDLRAVIKQATKYTFIPDSGLNSDKDYLWCPSEYEIQGTRTYADASEAGKQLQYDYFKAGNSKVAYRFDATTTSAYWWCRSPSSGNSTNFCYVYTDGTAHGNVADASYAVCPCFRV